jgi:type IV pilus assembly protein PilM
MPMLGLDLGTHTFRAIELGKTKQGYLINKYGIYENPKINLDPSSPQVIQDYADHLKTFVSETNFSTPKVVVSLPEEHVFMRVIGVPNMKDRDLKNSIAFEAEQHLPFPLKEVSMSYQKIGQSVAEPGRIDVQLVAAQKTILEKYVSILKKAKLIPVALEPETLAMGRALGDPVDSPYASIILNVGLSNTLVVIYYKGFVRFTRTLSMGGDALTRAIQQGLNLDYMQAEEYKKTYGLDSQQVSGKIYQVLKPIFDTLISEIKRSKLFFTTHTPNVTINKVIISGGTALLPGLLVYLANNLDLEVELANPWKNMQISSKLGSQKDYLLGNGPIFATALGLALKEL